MSINCQIFGNASAAALAFVADINGYVPEVGDEPDNMMWGTLPEAWTDTTWAAFVDLAVKATAPHKAAREGRMAAFLQSRLGGAGRANAHKISIWYDSRGWHFYVRAVDGTGHEDYGVAGQLLGNRSTPLRTLREGFARIWPMPTRIAQEDAAWTAAEYGLGWDTAS